MAYRPRPHRAVLITLMLLGVACGFASTAPEDLMPTATTNPPQSRRGHAHHQHKRPPPPNKDSGGNSIGGNATVATLANTTKPFADCDYFQNLETDKSYDIYSPGYAQMSSGSGKGNNNYAPDTHCRWIAVAPKEHTIRLHCTDVALPRSTDCLADRLEISGGGRADLADAKRFCGVGSFVSDSNANKLAIALRTHHNSIGGHFRCRISSIRLPPGTTQYCQCGIRNRNRIVGGMETGVNEFPMMTGLIQAPTVAVYCGATIIQNNLAVTAAHCVTDRQADQLGLLVGDHNYLVRNDSRYAALYRVAETIVHSDYNVTSGLNDIALVRTAQRMEFNEGVSAVCLPFKYALWQATFVNEMVLALGWGTQEFGGPLSPYLQEVGLTVIENSQCAAAYTAEQITAAQICTYQPSKDTCQSDSGGPLLYTDTGSSLLYLVGTVAYGNGCASVDPGVNMRTTSYLGWIMANTPGVVYCFK